MEILNDNPSLDIIVKDVDLSIISNVHKLYQELKPYHIETWINNAGFGNYERVANQNLENIEIMLRLNVEGLARELQECNAKLQAKVLAPAATRTNFGNVANNIDGYDYDKSFGSYHTSEQMA